MGGLVHLSVVRVGRELHKENFITLAAGYVATYAGYDCLIVAYIYLSISFQMVKSRLKVF